MIEVVDTNINSFASMSKQNDSVSPSDSKLITLSIDQLGDLIKTAVNEATKPISEKVRELEKKVTALQKHADGIDKWTEGYAENYAHLAQKVYAHLEPEKEAKTYSSKVVKHLDTIYEALQERAKSCAHSAQKWDFMSFWDAAQLLDLSHRRISQLAEIARNDPRFIIGWHPKKPNTKVFRISPYNLGNLVHTMSPAFSRSTRDMRVNELLVVS
jgi:hypothetical protein